VRNTNRANHLANALFLAGTSCLAATVYDMKQLSIATNLPESTVIQWMHEFQAIEEWNENTAHYYGIFSRLINTYNLKKGCEVGIATGGHSYDILKKTNVETLYCVDPFSPELFESFAARGVLDLYFHRITARFSEFGERAHMIRKYSLPAASLFADNELDFVFIDADHTYKSVQQDIQAWYAKVRNGGIIGGDDYTTKWPGVPQAVNEFFTTRGLVVNTDKNEPRIWWVHKP